jgi:hypothetical protein
MPTPALFATLALVTVPVHGSTSEEEVASAVHRGVTILVDRQEDYAEGGKADARPGKGAKDAPTDGPREWPYEGVYRVGGQIPIGYRVGGTSICATALLEAEAADGRPLPPDARASVDRALAFVLEGLDHPLMSAGFEKGYDVRGWGHAYALGFLVRARELGRVPEPIRKRVDTAIRGLVDTLEKTAIGKQGGWNYSRGKDPDDARPSSFMTAPTLQFLFEAARAGEKVDATVVERALDILESGRLESGAFQYGIAPERASGEGFEAVEGSIGRSPACEATLFLAGRGSVERVRQSIDDFFTHWEWLEKRRKQTGTHVAPFMIAPYYFFYAHRHTAQAIELLPEAERAAYRDKLLALLWLVREEDGGWNDRVFPRSESFGTAMTMMALLSPRLPVPARWKAQPSKSPKKAPPGKGAEK